MYLQSTTVLLYAAACVCRHKYVFFCRKRQRVYMQQEHRCTPICLNLEAGCRLLFGSMLVLHAPICSLLRCDTFQIEDSREFQTSSSYSFQQCLLQAHHVNAFRGGQFDFVLPTVAVTPITIRLCTQNQCKKKSGMVRARRARFLWERQASSRTLHS